MSIVTGVMTVSDMMSPSALVAHSQRVEGLGYGSGPPPLNTPGNPPPVPVYLAAHGPKMMAVAAGYADGAMSYLQS